MIKTDFNGESLSLLGFGAMRLPKTEDGSIDEARTDEMIRAAIEGGVNYFDTAYPYHGGESEIVIGRLLKKYPRESYNLATKYPGHQISESYNPSATFEEQLRKCGVEYFDYYLLHNVCESSYGVYTDPKWGILDYFREQKRLGRIRHLGFSTHGSVETIGRFLEYCEGDMEFCQIQINYLDWTLQNAKEKYDLLTEHGVPVWAMEPVRGGRLAVLDGHYTERLNTLRPGVTPAAWCFRFLQDLPNVKMILSGMSDMEQVGDNLRTFNSSAPLTSEEHDCLMRIAEGMKNSVPCTACRYCCDGCPAGLDIPLLISTYNELRFAGSVNISMRMEALPVDKRPSACISCGKCKDICPQSIDVPKVMGDLTCELAKLPRWSDICRQRDEEQRKLKEI